MGQRGTLAEVSAESLCEGLEERGREQTEVQLVIQQSDAITKSLSVTVILLVWSRDSVQVHYQMLILSSCVYF